MKPVKPMMTALPRNMRMKPMPEIIVNRAQFLTIRKKVAMAARQKNLSVSTTWM